MSISLLHPSRNRSAKAYITYCNWMSKAANPGNIEHILSIDSDETDLRYSLLFTNHQTFHTNSKIIVNPNTCAVQATNEAAKVSNGNILIMLSDDFDCPEKWDILIENAYLGHLIRPGETGGGYVLKVFDGTQKWIVTLAIMDMAYYEMQGYFYFPGYQHLFCDTDMTHKAELEGRLIFRNDLVFKHNHYTCTNGKQDETTKRADATWESGERLYLQRVRDKFGLGDIDVLNLGKEAHEAGHIEWLTDKLNGGNAKMRLPKRQKLFR